MRNNTNISNRRIEDWKQREKDKKKLIDEQMEYLIAKALSSNSGKQALAQAMVQPIKKAMDYLNAGRNTIQGSASEKQSRIQQKSYFSPQGKAKIPKGKR